MKHYLLAIATIFTVTFASVAQGSAISSACASLVGDVKYKSSTWGCSTVSGGQWLVGYVGDNAHDGHCVYLRVRVTGQSWPGNVVPNSKTCNEQTPLWINKDYGKTSYTISGTRLYREDGRYLTIWGS